MACIENKYLFRTCLMSDEKNKLYPNSRQRDWLKDLVNSVVLLRYSRPT
jgi:hypothetical protein